MSNSTLTVNFAYADSTVKNFTVGPFAVNSEAVSEFKLRLKAFDAVNSSGKKYTNLSTILKSDSGAALSGIKSAYIITSQSKRIYDAGDFGG